MRYATTLLTLLLITVGSAQAGSRTATFYSDGALVEIETQAAKGIAETALPADMADDTLRITPQAGTVIQTVEIQPPRVTGKNAKELEALVEQRRRLEDRLQALATREEIFKAAAKSQSGKAPRKTKANPDPLQSIRQGTDFAIAQLEAVYTSRRKTDQEIRRLDARIAAIRKSVPGAETIARVTVTPRNGRIKVRYALTGQAWSPRYDLRLNKGDSARLTLYGQLPNSFPGYQVQAAAGSLANGSTTRPLSVSAGSLAKLAEYSLPISESNFEEGLRSAFSCVLTNSAPDHLPAGEAAFYRDGEYRGQLRFEGISSGRSRRVSSGR